MASSQQTVRDVSEALAISSAGTPVHMFTFLAMLTMQAWSCLGFWGDWNRIMNQRPVAWRQGAAQPSRAQKRRDAKAAAEAEREARIAEEQDALGDSTRVLEERSLQELLAPLGLAVQDIPVRCRCCSHQDMYHSHWQQWGLFMEGLSKCAWWH